MTTPALSSRSERARILASTSRNGAISFALTGRSSASAGLSSWVARESLLLPETARRKGLKTQANTAEAIHALGPAVVKLTVSEDSRRLGKRVLKSIREEAFGAIGNGHSPEVSDSLWTIPADSDIGRRYVAALAAATHAGFANRAALTQILRRAMRAVLDDSSLALPLIYDCAHESIQREDHGGHAVWVHRHGASRALPPSALAGDPVLGNTGQPAPIPGSMGTESYIGVTREGVDETFHSVAHGAGRVIEKIHAAEQFDPEQIERDLGTDGIRLYRYGTDNIAGQAPASFKNVRRVVEAMTAFDLIRPVVQLRPIAVLKG